MLSWFEQEKSFITSGPDQYKQGYDNINTILKAQRSDMLIVEKLLTKVF